tara:strand:+ start:495 stop:2018 length:1524 start_codon:yes stop_codon:yes gene_type:complete
MYSAQAGPDFEQQQGWTPTAEDLPSGLAVADFDGDGRADVFWPTGLFLTQEDGTLSNVTSSHLADFGYDIEGLSAADYDGDGDHDVLATGFNGFRLLENDGSGVFTNVTASAGLDAAPLNTGTSAWADYDLDGDLDLAVMVLESLDPEGESLEAIIEGTMPAGLESRLYENQGDGTFVHRVDLLPPAANQGYTCAGGWHDVDADGRLDLYLVNDFGPQVQGNRLLRNTEDGFTDVSQSLALDVEIYGMGLGMGDLNGDGVPDFLATSWEDIALLESSVDGTWYRSELARGVVLGPDQHASWGAHLVDMDNDTDLDALVAFGNLPDHGAEESQQIEEGLGLVNTPGQPDALFIQREDGGFFDSASSWNLDDDRDGYSIVPVDLNGDGWLDAVKSDRIWLSRCGDASWIRVVLWGPSPNHFAVGARVTVEADGRSQHRWVVAGSTGHGSSMPPEAHFGLATAERVDRITVTWPDGAVSVVEGLEARRVVRLVREDASLEPPPLPLPSLF